MTVFNGAKYLQETLDAVWAQSFTGFELVVVNNGSTDGTQVILDSVNDHRLRIIQAPHHGTFGDGIRLAYQNAKGKYIAVQDGDDVPMVDRFAKQVAALDADKSLGLVSSAFEDIDQDGYHLGTTNPPTVMQDMLDAMQTANPLAHSTYMYRKVATDAVGGYPLEYAYGPDFGLVIRLIKAGWGVRVLGDVLLKLRQ
ncbi:MAG: glycosyltransferase, partial [Magnetovibrio sp.]|nr:glycosyltransferase [Magnetovibrio sp.]